MAAKIELLMKANTQGAVQNLKATQANIDKVADAFVKLQNEGVGLDKMNTAVAEFGMLIDRLAMDMTAMGDAASLDEAKVNILGKSLSSAARMYNGEFSEIADHMTDMYVAAFSNAEAYKQLSGEATKAKAATEKLVKVEKEAVKVEKSAASATRSHGLKLLEITTNILKFQLVMQPITSAIRAFKDMLRDSIDTAAEAEQTFSKLGTVFSGVSGAAEAVGKLSKEIGVSGITAANALSTVGDLLQAQGATTVDSLRLASEWVGKFQDIIAFKDIDMSLEEFAQNFMSGAAGNLRNFRTFGSIVKESAVNARLAAEGMDKLTGSELELAKMTARAEMALEQQKNAIGATEREWDTMLSINRRYEEAWKTTQQHVGDSLKPIIVGWKSTVTEFLDWLNDNAEHEAEKRKNFADTRRSARSISDPKFIQDVWEASVEEFDTETYSKIIKLYGATTNDIITAIENNAAGVTKDQISAIRVELEKLYPTIVRTLDSEEELQTMNEETATYSQTIDKLFESLQAIDGVSFVGSTWYKELLNAMADAEKGGNTEEFITDFYERVFDSFSYAAKEAVEDIKASGADPIDILLGKADEGTSIQGRISSLESLYRVMANSGKFAADSLSAVKDAIDAEVSALSEFNAEQERLAKLQAVFQAGNLSGTDYAGKTAEADFVSQWESGGYLSEEHARAVYAIQEKMRDAQALTTQYSVDWFKVQLMATSELKDAEKYYRRIAEDAEKAKKAEYEKYLTEKKLEAIQKRLDSVSGYTDQANDYRKQLRQLGMTDSEKVIDDLRQELLSVGWDDDELRKAIQDTIDAFKELDAETKRRAEAERKQQEWQKFGSDITSSLGNVGTVINGYTTGSTGNAWLDTLKVMFDLMTQTEEWANLMTTLNSALDPFMIALSGFVDMLSSTLIPVLRAVQPLLKVFASAVAIIGYAVETVVNTVFMSVAGLISDIIDGYNWSFLSDIFGYADKPEWVEELLNAQSGNDDALLDILDRIWKADLETSKNTAKNDYATYVDLLSRKYITADQYASLIGPNRYSSSTTTNGVTMTTGGYGNATYISIHGLTLHTDISDGPQLVTYLNNLDRGVLSHGTAY